MVSFPFTGRCNHLASGQTVVHLAARLIPTGDQMLWLAYGSPLPADGIVYSRFNRGELFAFVLFSHTQPSSRQGLFNVASPDLSSVSGQE